MKNNKQTAVDWLIKQMVDNWHNDDVSFEDLYKQAKAIEKQQIIHAYGQGTADEAGEIIDATKSAEHYYNEKYGN